MYSLIVTALSRTPHEASLYRLPNYAEGACLRRDREPRVIGSGRFVLHLRFENVGQDMITGEYLGTSRLFRRLKSGRHRQLIELYTARLVRDELAGQRTWRCLNMVSYLISWIKRCGLS